MIKPKFLSFTSSLEISLRKGLFFVLLATATGCSTSLVYSPSTHTAAAYDKGTTVMSAGVSGLPETMPELSGRTISPGAEGRLGYQFTDKLRLDAKYFASFNSPSWNGIEHGVGVLAIIGDNDTSGIIGAVQGQFILRGAGIEGGGWAGQLGYRWMVSKTVNVSAIGGPTFGYRNFDEHEWGAGGIVNLAGGVEVIPNGYVSLDAALVIAYDAWTRSTFTVLTPSLMFSLGI